MPNPVHGLTIANFPADILYGEGVVYIGSAKFGVTKGPPKWNPNRTFENIGFDGKYAPIKGLDRPMNGEPSLAFTMLEIGDSTTGNQIVKFEPGLTTATVSTTITKTPALSGALVAAGSYAADVRVIWERGAAASGNYFAVYFPVGLFNKYDISGQDKKEALIAVEVVGRLDLATQQITDAAYKYEYRTTLP